MKTSLKVIHWAPRIICILAILLVGMFALDVFDSGYTFWQTVLALFMHLIPNFILIILLVIAWKWELAGGLILGAVALLLSPPVFFINYGMNHSVWMSLGIILVITGPFILTGGLFVLSHFMKKKEIQPGSGPVSPE
jgi:hypothetical protein